VSPARNEAGAGSRSPAGHRRARVAPGLGLAVWFAIVAACATPPAYEAEMASTRAALERGDVASARGALTHRLAAREGRHAEAALLRLELATVALAEGDWAGAAEALAEADPMLEVIDLTRDDAGEVLSWLYADAARPYRSPPWEKLMVNVLGMAARLAADDVRGALVEARRFEVIARYFRERADDPGGVLEVGELLAAVAHARVGRQQVAARYERALRAKHPELFDEAGPAAGGDGEGHGEVLVVVAHGRVPHKVGARVTAAELERLAVQPGAGAQLRAIGEDRLPFVELRGARSPGDLPRVQLGDVAVQALWADLGATTRAGFEAARPRLARAAVTRALSRGGVHQTLAALDRSPRDGQVGFAAGLGGSLAAAMRASDVPDTRSWSTLPASLGAARVSAPAGAAVVTVTIGDERREVPIVVPPRGIATAVVIAP